MQGANSQGRTLIVLSSTTSTSSGSQGLTSLYDKGLPLLYSNNVHTTSFGMVGRHHDDITMFHPVIMTRIDDIIQHHHGNHGRLLPGWFTVNLYSNKVKQLLLFLTSKDGTDILEGI